MSFGISFGLVDRVPPGVVGVDGGDAELPPVTVVVSGNTFDVPSVDASCIDYSIGGRGGFLLCIDCLPMYSANPDLLCRVATLHIDESTRPHRLRHHRRWALG